jgi:ABC-2 type transport system permease protein
MPAFGPLFKREFFGYFRSPIAYVFIMIFLLSSVGCAFFLGGLYESNQADLTPFFNYLPWLYLVLVPAVGMRLWAEERRTGTIELLFTWPTTMAELVLSKFLAGWAFLCVALALTFPLWLTITYLGSPDHGVIIGSYLGAALVAGAYLSITCFTSAITKNQVVSFILSVVVCFVLVLLGWGVFTETLSAIFPVWMVDLIASAGFVTHFHAISKGLIDSRDVIYFASVIVVSLSLNAMALEARRSR